MFKTQDKMMANYGLTIAVIATVLLVSGKANSFNNSTCVDKNCSSCVVETCSQSLERDVLTNSSCNSQCLTSLEQALSNITQEDHDQFVSVKILLCSDVMQWTGDQNYTISSTQNITKFHLTSTYGCANVICSEGASIMFSGNIVVTVSEVSFTGCNINGTLQFVDLTHTVTIERLTLIKSGLSFIDVSGNVTISETSISEVKSLHTSPLTIHSTPSQHTEIGSLLFSLTNSNISNNIVDNRYNVEFQETTRGGGMLIDLRVAKNTNNITITGCRFVNNSAYLGGGLSINARALGDNTISIQNSLFHENKAEIGSALDIYCLQPPVDTGVTKHCLHVGISNSNFSKNTPLNDSLQTHSATLKLKHTDLWFHGQLHFEGNNGSAISSYESEISLNQSANIIFSNNVAQQGAGLNLLASFFFLYRNTTVQFLHNRAIIAGGAIYANQMLDLYIPYSLDCFIVYNGSDCEYSWDHSCKPDNWNASLTFEDNKALNGMAIFAVSILTCIRRGVNTKMEEDINATFCNWKTWKFLRGGCQIDTSPHRFENKTYNLSNVISGLPIPYKLINLTVKDELGRDITSQTVFTMFPAKRNNKLIASANYNTNIIVSGKGPHTEEWYIQTVGERAITAAVTINMVDCPPGFRYSSKERDCVCIEALRSVLKCRPNKTALIQVAYCVSFDDAGNKTVYGRCIFTTGKTVDKSKIPFKNIPQNITKFCWDIDRKDLLCGNCRENYSVDVFSDSFQCNNCTGSLINWAIYILVESIPIFILFTAVVALHLSLTSGPVNGYIFCCQVITVTIEVIFTQTSLEKAGAPHPHAMTNALLIPSNIWSLDFFRIYKLVSPNRPVCLGWHLKVMHLVTLRYLSAFYPLIFLIVSYILIELHARNCCCLVKLWSPIGYFISRFRRTFNIRTSLVDAFATFILLSYVKIIRVSLLLTTYNTVYDMSSKIVGMVLHYDPTISYGSMEHIPFLVVGILLLVSFGLFFPLLLLFYQFLLFQRCLNYLRLNRNGLRIFMDAFQGCYKDGKDNGPDRRYFAGLYFVFRLLVFVTFNAIWDNKKLYLTLQSLMILFALVTAILRPYKKELYNITDIVFFCLLGVAFGLHVYVFDKAETSFEISDSAVYISYALELIPFVYVMFYMVVWVGKRFINKKYFKFKSLYIPLDNSISWRFNDTDESHSLLRTSPTHVYNGGTPYS